MKLPKRSAKSASLIQKRFGPISCSHISHAQVHTLHA